MNSLNIDIDSLVLRLRLSITPARAENIANNALEILEDLLRNYSFDHSFSANGFRVGSMNVSSLSTGEGESDIEISKTVAYEIYCALLKMGGL